MRIRTFALAAGVVFMAASAALAAGLTERLQTERMTVLKVDRSSGQFQCAEHRRWMTATPASLASVGTGDIVRVERTDGRSARLIVLRSAADELASPE
ncbi:MAG TPA: hypothetical protein VIX40_01540 [Methylomirabilota bacterium]